MIKIENEQILGWEAAIRGARNPMNSWDRSDSMYNGGHYEIGPNDLDLMKRLVQSGPDHAKFMRFITVTVDITAPIYWNAEFDTYKVGVTRNSCSFMHKGVAKPFEVTDFSVRDKRIYEILSPLPQKESVLSYKYETEDYKPYICENGRKYRVYRNGRVFAEPFKYTDAMGRERSFDLKECKPYKTRQGYYQLHLGGGSGENWELQRLVLATWTENPDLTLTVNHIDGDKGNNCVENLEWCSIAENSRKGFELGLFDRVGSLHANYIKWKRGHANVDPLTKHAIKKERGGGATIQEIEDKYDLTKRQVYNILHQDVCNETELYMSCYMWEKIIDELNALRDAYLETKDDEIFQQIRCLLPMGYNQRYTVILNYQVLRNMYRARKNHRLSEWHDFCHWIESLPQSELITM